MNNDMPILLIDDDEVDIESVRRAFKKNNFRNPLYVASNGVEAMDLLCGTQNKKKLNPLPQIILLDIKMPKIDGVEFLKSLRANEALKSISVFILTSSQEEKDIVSAYVLHVAGYIIKPVSFENLIERIKILTAYWSLIELPSEGAI